MNSHIFAIVNSKREIVRGPFRTYGAAKGAHDMSFKGNRAYKIAWYSLINAVEFDEEVIVSSGVEREMQEELVTN